MAYSTVVLLWGLIRYKASSTTVAHVAGSSCSISHCVDMPPHTSKHMSLASSLYHCTYTQDAYAAAGQLEAMRDAVKWPLDYFMWVGNQPRLRVSYCKWSRLLID